MKVNACRSCVGLIILITLVGLPKRSSADASVPTYNPAACGINCVYGALRVLGKQLSWTDLAKSEYISAPEGSSLADLAKAVADHGAYATKVQDLSASTLLKIPGPVIINVKGDISTLKYDHWVIVMREPNGWLRLFDPPNDDREIRPSELAGRWRGVGLIVSDRPLSADTLARIHWWQLSVSLLLLTPILLAALGARLFKFLVTRSWSPLSNNVCLEIAVVLAVATLIGFLYHFFSEDGLLSRSETLVAVMRSEFSNFIAKVDVAGAKKMQSEGTMFIDARLPADYQNGHIPGAINIAVGEPKEARNVILGSIDRNSPLVIYCQSSSCPYSDAVARELSEDGYNNLILFRDGWIGWSAAVDVKR